MRLLRVPMLVCHRTIHQHDTMLLIETMSMTVIYHAAASTLPVTPARGMAEEGHVRVVLHVVPARPELVGVVLAWLGADDVLDSPWELVVDVGAHVADAAVSMKWVMRRSEEGVPY